MVFEYNPPAASSDDRAAERDQIDREIEDRVTAADRRGLFWKVIVEPASMANCWRITPGGICGWPKPGMRDKLSIPKPVSVSEAPGARWKLCSGKIAARNDTRRVRA